MRKVADELGLELLKTVENGAYEEVVMETILVTADEFIFVCFRPVDTRSLVKLRDDCRRDSRAFYIRYQKH